MSWAALAIALVLAGVAYLLATMRGIDRAQDELAHYRLSVRFWGFLAVLGLLLGGSFAYPIHVFFEAGRAAWLTSGLISIPFVVVVLVGVRNAYTLFRAHRRRRMVMGSGVTIPGRVIRRTRGLFQDVMMLVVEADLPDPHPSAELQYRPRDQAHTVRHRFIECCPTDHWNRFAPGRDVRLEIDPDDPRRFAVHVFANRSVMPA